MRTGYKKCILLAAGVALCLISCSGQQSHAPYPGRTPSGGDETPGGEIPGSSTLKITPIAELNQRETAINSHKGATERSSLMRDYRSYTDFEGVSLGGDYPVYPRLTRARNGRYILVYHQGNSSTWAGNRTFMLSSDDLVNWRSHGLFNDYESITDDFGYANTRAYAGPNILTLSNGDILSSVSFRAMSSTGGHSYRENHNSSGILIRRSKDNGQTWDKGTVIFNGINWETHLVEASNGDIHCYFTNSDPYLAGVVPEWPEVTNNSGTSVVISRDGGYTWKYEGYVVRQARGSSGDVVLFTDQMPVVISLNETGEMAGAFESQMKPPTGGTSDYWVSLAYSGTGKTEYPILTGNTLGPSDRKSSYLKGAGPFLAQFPSGETVLSYNTSNYINVHLGDETARNFDTAYQRPLLKKGFWSAMYVDGAHRLLLSSGGSNKTLQLVSLYLNHDIEATRRSVVCDAGNSEWENTDDALFVGSKSQAQATVRCSADDENLYFLVEVLDENISTSDYATILLGTPSSTLSEGALRVQLSVAGIKSQARYRSSWFQEDLGIQAFCTMEGSAGDAKDTDKGWICELKIPRSSLPASVSGALSFDFALFDMAGGEDSVAAQNLPAKWPLLGGI